MSSLAVDVSTLIDSTPWRFVERRWFGVVDPELGLHVDGKSISFGRPAPTLQGHDPAKKSRLGLKITHFPEDVDRVPNKHRRNKLHMRFEEGFDTPSEVAAN